MRAMQVMEGAEPFSSDAPNGDDSSDRPRVGVVVCHGYTGTPQGVRPWAQHLADAGYTVRLPRLPGHGTTWRELNNTRWHDWYGAVDAAFRELHERCEHVFVTGLSMGGLLATKLAIDHGPRVAGLALVNPIFKHTNRALPLLPVLRHVVPSLPGITNDIRKPDHEPELGYDRNPLHAMHSQVQLWAEVSRDLPEVTQPALLLHSRVDHVVPPVSSAWFLSRISSTDVREIWLENSYHVATLDNDAPLIHDETVSFIERLTS